MAIKRAEKGFLFFILFKGGVKRKKGFTRHGLAAAPSAGAARLFSAGFRGRVAFPAVQGTYS